MTTVRRVASALGAAIFTADGRIIGHIPAGVMLEGVVEERDGRRVLRLPELLVAYARTIDESDALPARAQPKRRKQHG